MAGGDFEVVARKMARAEQHLHVFGKEVTAYVDRHPIAVEVDPDVEPSAYVQRAVLREKPPDDLPLIMGDFLSNLRATLDYLAWQLVLAQGKSPGRKTSFPIHGSGNKSIRITGGVPAEALTRIAAVQPYHRGNQFREHPLWILDHLNNVNKHRYLALITAGYKGGVTTWYDARGAPYARLLDAYLELADSAGKTVRMGPSGEHGAIVGSFAKGPQGEMAVDTQLTTRVLLKELGEDPRDYMGVNAEDVLESLYLFVRDEVVRPLKPFVG